MNAKERKAAEFLKGERLCCALVRAVACACIAVILATAAHSVEGDTARFYQAVYRDGVLYTGAPDGRFVAVGVQLRQVQWTFQDTKLDGFLKPAVTDEGVFLLAGRPDSEATEAIALDRSKGRILWRQPFGKAGRSSSPVTCGGNLILVDRDTGRVIALDAKSGKKQWDSGRQPYFYFNPPAIEGGNLYFIYREKAEDLSGGVAVLNCADGKLLRTIHVEGIGTSECPIILRNGAAILTNRVYDAPSQMMLLDLRMGNINWRITIPPRYIPGSCPAIVDDHMVCGSGGLWVLDLETGRTLASHEIDESTSDTVVYAHSIVFMAGSRSLAAFRIEPFARIWKTRFSSALTSNVVPCDDALCVQTQSGKLAVLDARSGKVRGYVPLLENQPTTSGIR